MKTLLPLATAFAVLAGAAQAAPLGEFLPGSARDIGVPGASDALRYEHPSAYHCVGRENGTAPAECGHQTMTGGPSGGLF